MRNYTVRTRKTLSESAASAASVPTVPTNTRPILSVRAFWDRVDPRPDGK